MIQAFSGTLWLIFALVLFFWTKPDGTPVLGFSLGGKMINAAWLALLMVLWNAARYYQYISRKKSD